MYVTASAAAGSHSSKARSTEMQKRDPYSTPARRRRIIAEFAKKVLKQYCIDACRNVVVYRIHTKAVLTLQCSVRSYLARKRVARIRKRKRRRAATRIQCVVRIMLAKKRRKRIIQERHRMRQLRLNHAVHRLIDIRKQRLARIAMMIALRLAREKRQRLAAINIQRVFRGHQARLAYRIMYERHKAHQRLLHRSTAVIQSRIRTYLAVKRYRYWSTRRRALKCIQQTAMNWWVYRKYRRNKNCRVIQRIVRGHLGRKYALNVLNIREEARKRVSQALSAEMELAVVDELIRKVAGEVLPQEQNMIIHVDVDALLLQKLSERGPAEVVLWCLSNSLLEYRCALGYRAGAVVQQVVRSVETALQQPPDVPNLPGGQSAQDVSDSAHPPHAQAAQQQQQQQQQDRVIALSKWEEGDSADVPSQGCLPANWNRLAYDTSRDQPVGAAVSVDRAGNERVEVHIATVVESAQSFTRSTITIAFNSTAPTNQDTHPDSSTTAPAIASNAALSSEQGLAGGVNELKFRFKNALVYVNAPQPALPSPPKIPPAPASMPVEEVVVFDDDCTSDDELELVAPPAVVEEAPERPARPATAVVRIVLRDPTPPPPPIDYDGKATTLQMLVRRWHLRRASAARTIQRAARRIHRVGILQELVYSILEVAHDAATIIQCWLRRAAAQRRLAQLQQEFFRAHYGHDFLLSEAANWEAFGLSMQPEVLPLVEDLYRSPVLSVALQFPLEMLDQDLAKLVRAFGPPPAAAVLGLLDYPAPPPGCLFSTPLPPWQPATGSMDHCSAALLVSACIPDDVFTDPHAGGMGGNSIFAALVDLPCLSYEGSVRARMVRNALQAQCATPIVPARKAPTGESNEGGDLRTSDPPAASGQSSCLSEPTALSAQGEVAFRRECLGDLTTAESAGCAPRVSVAQWLGGAAPSAQDVRAAQAVALENSSPIYRRLLANLTRV